MGVGYFEKSKYKHMLASCDILNNWTGLIFIKRRNDEFTCRLVQM